MSAIHDRVFWHGRHTVWNYASPLGKLPKSALRDLVKLHDWREVDRDDTSAIPVFTWTTRRAADFPAIGARLPNVRQLPQSSTACLDDKVRLAELLADRGVDNICPPTFINPQALQAALHASPADALWFVKHRFGVKGRAVQPMRSCSLTQWLQRCQDRNVPLQDFAIQQEVAPPALWEQRKFALRAHVLVACRGETQPPAAWMHHDVIVLPHAAPHVAGSEEKAVQVSNVGKHHPSPRLTTQLPSDHPATHTQLWPLLIELASRTLTAAQFLLLPSPRCPESTLYSVLAFDVALDAHGVPWLLEVNSHCALGDGTMAAVDASVYDRLVAHVLALLVLPGQREEVGMGMVTDAAESPSPQIQTASARELETVIPDAGPQLASPNEQRQSELTGAVPTSRFEQLRVAWSV